jgi:hypothetical protein
MPTTFLSFPKFKLIAVCEVTTPLALAARTFTSSQQGNTSHKLGKNKGLLIERQSEIHVTASFLSTPPNYHREQSRHYQGTSLFHQLSGNLKSVVETTCRNTHVSN